LHAKQKRFRQEKRRGMRSETAIEPELIADLR